MKLKELKKLLEEEKATKELDWIKKTLELHEGRYSPEELEKRMLQVRKDLWKRQGKEAPPIPQRKDRLESVKLTLNGNLRKLSSLVSQVESLPPEQQEAMYGMINMGLFDLLKNTLAARKKQQAPHAKTRISKPTAPSGEKTKVDKSGRKTKNPDPSKPE